LRSFEDNVVPLANRRIWFGPALKWPLFIAFFTTVVNDGNDETDCIGSFCVPLVLDETLEDDVWDFDVKNEFDDDAFVNDKALDCSDETISANGVHRLFGIDDVLVGIDRVGASLLSENFESVWDAWLFRWTR